jgi:Flp pilus assembly protein TadG
MKQPVSIRRVLAEDRGLAAVWTAVILLFLLGAAALAVDTSEGFSQARGEQRAADLACLAGAQELPNSAAAIQKTASFLRPNHPGLAALSPTTPNSGSITPGNNVWTLGDFTVEIESPYVGKTTQMAVTIRQQRPTKLGKAVGADNLLITQRAVCEVGSSIGGADMPFGLLPGFSGGLINFGKNQCTLNGESNDKCSGLAIPRHNDPPGSSFNTRTANNFIANMISGLNWGIGPFGGGDTFCDPLGGDEPCNHVSTVSGDDPSKLYNGLISGKSSLNYPGSTIGYLERGADGTYYHGNAQNYYDPHELPDVAECQGGSCPATIESVTWEADIAAGTFTQPPPVTLTRITDCDCPRFARIPVVASFPTANCTVPDPSDPSQVNKCSSKIVGFEWVFLMRPYYNAMGSPDGPDPAYNDFESSGSGSIVRTIAAIAIDFDADMVVEGDCFFDYVEGAPKVVRLISN